jgi:hypothetical protein
MKKSIQRAPAKSIRDYLASLVRPIITVTIGFLLALFSAALTYSTPPAMEGTFGGAAFFIAQPTSTPKTKDLSEIGSTDGIIIMGIVIALIIIVPILLRRKSWTETR